MLHNLESINKLYKEYQIAGAELVKAVEETFREVYKDFGFVPIKIEHTAVKPSTCDKLVQINWFYYDENQKLIFEDLDGFTYPVEHIAHEPMNMLLLYQSFAKDIKIR